MNELINLSFNLLPFADYFSIKQRIYKIKKSQRELDDSKQPYSQRDIYKPRVFYWSNYIMINKNKQRIFLALLVSNDKISKCIFSTFQNHPLKLTNTWQHTFPFRYCICFFQGFLCCIVVSEVELSEPQTVPALHILGLELCHLLATLDNSLIPNGFLL